MQQVEEGRNALQNFSNISFLHFYGHFCIQMEMRDIYA